MDLSAISGALIALSGAFVLQTLVVPRVEAGKRREQRWEDDVHALGELLTFDLPRAVNALTHELGVLAILTDVRKGPGWFEQLSDPQAKAKTASAELAGVRVRMDWLRDRVSALAPENPQSKLLVRYSQYLSVQLINLTTLEWKAEPTPDFEKRLTVEEIDEAREKIDTTVSLILNVVTVFGIKRPSRFSRELQVLRVRQERSFRRAQVNARLPKAERRAPAATDEGP